MSRHDMEAMRTADAGLDAGKALWEAVDAANIRREVLAFECALQSIGEEIEDEHERRLFEAAAMKAIPLTSVSTEDHTQIRREYDRAYVNLVHTRQADEDAAAADWAYDCARDEKLGDAA